ncbi:hypothetical protein [Vineibacter terrae]|uniref:hypothetical protein n=1 Tax=Vineibacter terrae TaxID=2586908 RepID=UPI002E36D017|nr:hypothetical protein [Vineibacter terrae]HEX2890755.1 hypothetical protein [Vineibacter terrae]
MNPRDMYEARAHAADPTEQMNARSRRIAAVGRTILDYATFIGLIAIGIILVGFVSNFLFGSSVTTAL